MAKPLLSIGIIFKNEIRCLERCLKSLQPLRDAVPSELVMADTGATDGSRAVAEKYADILIDFEWINDFAAARNAVMNQCSGKWYMSIDCDEWLGGDLSKLIAFLKTDEPDVDFGAVVVRNYSSEGLEKDGEYSDFDATRMLRMSTGIRYEGAIHENWPVEHSQKTIRLFREVLFHHDGYLYNDPVKSREKRERNMVLLRKKLEDNPGDLTTLLQCIESADGSPELMGYIEQAVKGIEEKREHWKILGPAILRYAVITTYKGGLPGLEAYIQKAEEMFPESIYTRIDVEFTAFGDCWGKKNYKECIRRGERYLEAVAKYDAGQYDRIESMLSTVLLASRRWRNQLRLFVAGSYLYEGQPEKGFAMLPEIDGAQMTVGNVNNAVGIYAHFHARSALDTKSAIRRLWDQISSPIPDEKRAKQRRNEFIRVGADYFRREYQDKEASRDDFRRHAYTIFPPVAGECPLGNAAIIMEKTNAAELEQLLSEIENWDVLPISALAHALNCGVRFPLRGKPMKMEELDSLAGRLSQDKEHIRPLIERIAENAVPNEVQTLSWARGLTLAALYIVNWKDESQAEWAMAVTRAFAKTEQAFLSRCYAEEMLCDENIIVLPPMHRFGWYLTRAFQALNSGDAVGYARMLREGLSSYENMKPAVEFLLKHTSELQIMPEPSEELRALADQVRTILAAYPSDDPAVEALKQSEAYQKVAYLIEGVEPPIVGGQMQ